MKKNKRILSIMTSVVMAGLVFGSSFGDFVTAYAKTNNKVNSEKTNNNINYNTPKFNAAASSSTKMSTARLSGANRYATAANITEAGWMGTSDYAIIATGENFPDALCAAPLAAKYNAPIILTESSVLNDSAKKELVRLQVKNAIIVGGVGAVSQSTENSIKALNINTTRISGKNRYETSEKIAEQVGSSSQVVMATGSNFPDALSIAGIAAIKGMPILLTDVNAIPAETLGYLNANKATITKTYVVGGTGVISDAVFKGLKNAQRLAGNNRYDTNAAITNLFGSDLNSGNVYITTGQNFPDALACSALAPITDSAIILADAGSENAAQSYEKANIGSMGTVIAVGGTGAVPDLVLNNAASNYGKAYNNSVVASPFKNANFEKVVRNTIKKPSGNFYKSDLNSVVFLNACNYGISDISGADKLVNLKNVSFGWGNTYKDPSYFIKDITPLKDLQKLSSIDLSHNAITDISALIGKSKLQYLYLSNNKIINISPLQQLINLKSLDLNSNEISDISILKGLTKLQELDLGTSMISDIRALEGLTNLQSLNLGLSTISDIRALKGLTNLQSLDLRLNLINDISVLEGLTNLQELNLYGNSISNISMLKGLTKLQKLDLGNNRIIYISILSGFLNLKELNLKNNQISDISALQGLTNLNYLCLDTNQVSDVSPLKGLTNLTTLYLSDNLIKDISTLKGLTKLQNLSFSLNQISNISILSGFTNLQTLSLYHNQISNISALKGLSNLNYLRIDGNQIINISELKGLTNLQELYLQYNQISDISTLKVLTNLRILDLRKNNISDADKTALIYALPNCKISFE